MSADRFRLGQPHADFGRLGHTGRRTTWPRAPATWRSRILAATRRCWPAGFLSAGPVHLRSGSDGHQPEPQGDLYAPGTTIHGNVTATDGPPGHMAALTWTYTEPAADDGSQRDPVTGNCPSGLRSDHIDCTFDVTISPDLDPDMTVNLDIVALDDAVPPNQSSPMEHSHQAEPAPHRVLGHAAVRRRGGRNQRGDPRIGLCCRESRLLRRHPTHPRWRHRVGSTNQTITGYTPAHLPPARPP